jgi:K+-transporting ATPase KdpF subunit
VLGIRESVREALRGIFMDYLIAGVVSAGLFVYVLYALLRPERF